MRPLVQPNPKTYAWRKFRSYRFCRFGSRERRIVRRVLQRAAEELNIAIPAETAVSQSEVYTQRPQVKNGDTAFAFESDLGNYLANKVVTEPIELVQKFVKAINLVATDRPNNKARQVLQRKPFQLQLSLRPLRYRPISYQHSKLANPIYDCDAALANNQPSHK